MKILTLNTWQENGPWQDRWELIFKGLGEMKPDVIGFQEVFNPSWAAEIQKRTGYATLVFPEEPGGLAILSSFPVIQSGCLTYKSKSPNENYFRYLLFAELKTEKGPLAVFNTHWSWQLMDGKVRQGQAEEFSGYVRLKAEKMESVAMGDFNSVAWAPEMLDLKKSGWNDIYAKAHPDKAGLTWHNENPYVRGANHPMPDRRIDFILMRNPSVCLGTLKNAEVVFDQADSRGRYASDHFGVLATFAGGK